MADIASAVVSGKAAPRGRFPHIKRVGDFLFVSGISARKPDNSYAGVSLDAVGGHTLDIRVQTREVIKNIEDILRSQNADLSHLVDVTAFLLSMNEFVAFNETYAEFFDYNGPTRTTVAVHQLPHPHQGVEIKGIAYKPSGR